MPRPSDPSRMLTHVRKMTNETYDRRDALAVSIAGALPHETKLVEATLEQRFLPETPEQMIVGVR